MDKVLNLARKDLLDLYRGRLLFYLALYPILMGLAMRFLAPLVPIEHFTSYVAPGVTMAAPIVIGWAYGFNLIEEKEESTWLLLRVIPLRLSTYFLYKAGTAVGGSVVLSFLAAAVFGQPVTEPRLFIVSVIAVSFTAPLVALLLGALAGNKIEGLALGKILGFSLVTPGIVFLVPQPWQLLLSWNPWYWAYLGLLQAYAGSAALTGFPLNWPGYPSALTWLIPLVLGIGGSLFFARVYRLRVE